MSDKLISQLNNLPTPQDADLIAIVDTANSETKQTTFLQFKDRLKAILGLTGDDISDIDSRITNNADVLANTDKISYTDGAKVAGIETGATADQTGVEIKSLYESQSNTNAFTDALLTKLGGIASGAEVNPSDAEIATSYQTQVSFATQAEMEAGTVTAERRMSPQRVSQAIAGLGGTGGGGGAMISYLPSKTGSAGSRIYGAVKKGDILWSIQTGYLRRHDIMPVGIMLDDDPGATGSTVQGYFYTGATNSRSLSNVTDGDDYLYWQESSDVVRFDITTKTEVFMTKGAGVSITTSSIIVGDGVGNLYILNDNSTSMQKCTISGTTINLDSTITLPIAHAYYSGGSQPCITGDYLYYWRSAGSGDTCRVVKNKLSTNTTEWDKGGYSLREQTNTWDFSNYRAIFEVNDVVYIAFSSHDSEDYNGIFCTPIDGV